MHLYHYWISAGNDRPGHHTFQPTIFFINILSNGIMKKNAKLPKRTKNVVICCEWLRELLFVVFEQRKCSLPPFGILLLSELLKPLLGRTRSRDRCCGAIRLSHRPEPSGHAVHGEVDGLDIGGQHGWRFVLLRHIHRPQRGRYPICPCRSGNLRHRCGGD